MTLVVILDAIKTLIFIVLSKIVFGPLLATFYFLILEVEILVRPVGKYMRAVINLGQSGL